MDKPIWLYTQEEKDRIKRLDPIAGNTKEQSIMKARIILYNHKIYDFKKTNQTSNKDMRAYRSMGRREMYHM